MAVNLIFSIIVFVILLAMFVGSIFLQIFLSKKENKWLGLIIPIICFAISIIPVMGIAMFSSLEGGGVTTTTYDESGKVVSTHTEKPHDVGGNKVAIANNAQTAVPAIVFTLLMGNIPTVIYLLIYFACRNSINRKKQLDIMSIQDL